MKGGDLLLQTQDAVIDLDEDDENYSLGFDLNTFVHQPQQHQNASNRQTQQHSDTSKEQLRPSITTTGAISDKTLIDQQHKKGAKLKKLQGEYTEHIEKQVALKEFHSKEHQFRTIIDSFITHNDRKQASLDQAKEILAKIRSSKQTIHMFLSYQFPACYQLPSFLLTFLTNLLSTFSFFSIDQNALDDRTMNMRATANLRLSKESQQECTQEIQSITNRLCSGTHQQEERIKKEEFITKTLVHIQSRLQIQNEDITRQMLEYQELNTAVEKNIAYLDRDEKQTKAQNNIHLCNQIFVHRAMSHVAEIHSSVIVKTSAMKESAERYLQVEVNGYKDIKELLAETSERLYNTQEVIAGLVQQHQNKIKQQQELDSLIDHLSNFQLISIVFLRENPKDHFNPITLKLEPVFDEYNSSTKQYPPRNEHPAPLKLHGGDLSVDTLIANACRQERFTSSILQEKNIFGYAFHSGKSLSQIKGELEGDEAKARFIVNILNQFDTAHGKNIRRFFDKIAESYSDFCRVRDNLSGKIVKLEVEKKKQFEEFQSVSKELEGLKVIAKGSIQCVNIHRDIIEKSLDLDKISLQQPSASTFNGIISTYFHSAKFAEDYVRKLESEQESESMHPGSPRKPQETIIEELLTVINKNILPQNQSIIADHEEISKVYYTFLYAAHSILVKLLSLLGEIRNRQGIAEPAWLALIDSSMTFLREWKVKKRNIDETVYATLSSQLGQVDIRYVTDNIISERAVLDILSNINSDSSSDASAADSSGFATVTRMFLVIFRDRHTLRQITERIIEVQSEIEIKERIDEKGTVRERVEQMYMDSISLTNLPLKRSTKCLREILSSSCFMLKYVTKPDVVAYLTDVKKIYDRDLEAYLSTSAAFAEGNMRITIDESYLNYLLRERQGQLFTSANLRARRENEQIMDLFSRMMLILLKEKDRLKASLSKSNPFDPVKSYLPSTFTPRLNSMLVTLNNQKSSKIQLYQGRDYEQPSDSLQCVGSELQQKKRKFNLIQILKEHVSLLGQGEEEFVDIQADMMHFEKEREETRRLATITSTSSVAVKPNIAVIQQQQLPYQPAKQTQRASSAGQNTRSPFTQRVVSVKSLKRGTATATQEGEILQSSGKQSRFSQATEWGKDKVGGGDSHRGDTTNQTSTQQLQHTQNRILSELSRPITTISKEQLREMIVQEKSNIVHQQGNYRLARDEYIRARKIEDFSLKLHQDFARSINAPVPKTLKEAKTASQQLPSQQMTKLDSMLTKIEEQINRKPIGSSIRTVQIDANMFKSSKNVKRASSPSLPSSSSRTSSTRPHTAATSGDKWYSNRSSGSGSNNNQEAASSQQTTEKGGQQKFNRTFIEIMRDKLERKHLSESGNGSNERTSSNNYRLFLPRESGSSPLLSPVEMNKMREQSFLLQITGDTHATMQDRYISIHQKQQQIPGASYSSSSNSKQGEHSSIPRKYSATTSIRAIPTDRKITHRSNNAPLHSHQINKQTSLRIDNFNRASFKENSHLGSQQNNSSFKQIPVKFPPPPHYSSSKSGRTSVSPRSLLYAPATESSQTSQKNDPNNNKLIRQSSFSPFGLKRRLGQQVNAANLNQFISELNESTMQPNKDSTPSGRHISKYAVLMQDKNEDEEEEEEYSDSSSTSELVSSNIKKILQADLNRYFKQMIYKDDD